MQLYHLCVCGYRKHEKCVQCDQLSVMVNASCFVNPIIYNIIAWSYKSFFDDVIYENIC